MTPAFYRSRRAQRVRFAVAFLLVFNLVISLSPSHAAYAFAQEPQQQQMPAQPTVAATPPPSLSPQSTPTPQREPTIQSDTERQQREQQQPTAQQQQQPPTAQQRSQQSDPVSRLRYRQIGPFRGGRVATVAGIASQPFVYYFGATGGGVFKTTDGGVNWEAISDGFFKTGSVGAIGIGDSDPNTLYVGMGEATLRGNVSHGDGMYKSLDAGKT